MKKSDSRSLEKLGAIAHQTEAPRKTIEKHRSLETETAPGIPPQEHKDIAEQQTVERLRLGIRKATTKKEPVTIEKRARYIEEHLPEHLRASGGRPTAGAKMVGGIMRLKESLLGPRVEGREHLPKGAYLVVSNHSGGETGALLGAFHDQPLRIAAGEELNWSRSKIRSWFLKQLGMISVRESLANLADQEKVELLKRVPAKALPGYRRVAERDDKITPNTDFLRTTLACLLRGDAVAIFPEGLFLYDGSRSLRKAYGGMELIAQRYAALTGQELPIIPVGITKQRVRIGESITLEHLPEDTKPTDWIMRHLAAQLPSELRGVYGD